MHTSKILKAEHFTFAVRGPDGGWRDTTFDAFCPGWHPQDRVAVVAPQADVAVWSTAAAMLALTTRYYDHHRSSGRGFFDYPQHFVVMGERDGGIVTAEGVLPLDQGKAGEPWSQLDVWPGNKWHYAAPHPAAMLKVVFDLQIDRVLWPAKFFDLPQGAAPLLPEYAERMLRTHLKQVWVYQSADPSWRLSMDVAAVEVLAPVVRAIPGWSGVDVLEAVATMAGDESEPAQLGEMSVDAFIDRLSPVFSR